MRNMPVREKFPLRLEDRGIIVIEAHDHAARDLNARTLNSLDALQHGPFYGPDILIFLRLFEGGFIGGFDADEDGFNVRARHETHQFLVFGEIERRFRKEGKGVPVVLLILNDISEYAFDGLLIPDEIVIDDEHLVHVQPTQTIQFREDLRARLESREPPKGDDDVAKFAGEGTSPGYLQARIEIRVHLQQLEAGRRHTGHIGFRLLLIAPLPLTSLPIFQEGGPG